MWDKFIENAPGLINEWGPKIIIASLMLLVFWIASSIARKAIFAAGDKADLEYPVVRLMAMAARVTLLIAGIITSLGTLGVDVSELESRDGVISSRSDPQNQTTFAALAGAIEGRIKAMWILGENTLVSDPDVAHTRHALRAIIRVICNTIVIVIHISSITDTIIIIVITISTK